MTVAVNCIRKIILTGGPDLISVSHAIDDEDNLEGRFAGG